jgi:general secretion pathway protein D
VKLQTLRAAFSAGGSGAGGQRHPARCTGGGQRHGGASAGQCAGGGATPSTTPVGESPSPSTVVFIQADPATNSLIITAPSRYTGNCATSSTVDTRRAQIYIETLIVVDADKAADIGIQW